MPVLIDGRDVASDSEDWRNDCEARYLMRLPLDKRRELVKAREAKRSKSAVDELKRVMVQIHKMRQNDE